MDVFKRSARTQGKQEVFLETTEGHGDQIRATGTDNMEHQSSQEERPNVFPVTWTHRVLQCGAGQNFSALDKY